MGLLADRARARAQEARDDAAALRLLGREKEARELDKEATRHDTKAIQLDLEGR